MHFLVFLEHLTKVVHIVFEVSTSVGVFSVEVCVTLFIFYFFFYVLFVETDHSFFKFFEVSYMMKNFKYIVFEFFLKAVL